jgi:hypothetical protein
VLASMAKGCNRTPWWMLNASSGKAIPGTRPCRWVPWCPTLVGEARRPVSTTVSPNSNYNDYSYIHNLVGTSFLSSNV